MLADLAINLLAALIAFCAGILLTLLTRNLVDRRAARRLIGLPTPDLAVALASPVSIVPGTTKTTTEAQGAPLATIGTVAAYQKLMTLAAASERTLELPDFYFANDFPDERFDRNLICIGFPRTNRVTAEVLRYIDIPVKFAEHTLVDTTDQTEFAPILEDGVIVEDFGCLIRAANPFNPDRIVIIIAGTQTYGMKAAAALLSARNFWDIYAVRLPSWSRRMVDRMPGIVPRHFCDECFQLIVSTRVEGYFTSPPQLVRRHSLGQ
jgi:hypothetical protein